MKIVIEICTDSAAFRDNPYEVTRVLESLAKDLIRFPQYISAREAHAAHPTIIPRDSKGNPTGVVRYED